MALLASEDYIFPPKAIQRFRSMIRRMRKLRNTPVSDDGLRALVEHLPRNLISLKLDLWDTHVFDDGLRTLAQHLPSNLISLKLDLRDTQVSDGGLRALAEHLPSSLTRLTLNRRNTKVDDLLIQSARFLSDKSRQLGSMCACPSRRACFSCFANAMENFSVLVFGALLLNSAQLINARDTDGNTLTPLAAQGGYFQALKLLVLLAGNYRVLNKLGQYPVYLDAVGHFKLATELRAQMNQVDLHMYALLIPQPWGALGGGLLLTGVYVALIMYRNPPSASIVPQRFQRGADLTAAASPQVASTPCYVGAFRMLEISSVLGYIIVGGLFWLSPYVWSLVMFLVFLSAYYLQNRDSLDMTKIFRDPLEFVVCKRLDRQSLTISICLLAACTALASLLHQVPGLANTRVETLFAGTHWGTWTNCSDQALFLLHRCRDLVSLQLVFMWEGFRNLLPGSLLIVQWGPRSRGEEISTTAFF